MKIRVRSGAGSVDGHSLKFQHIDYNTATNLLGISHIEWAKGATGDYDVPPECPIIFQHQSGTLWLYAGQFAERKVNENRRLMGLGPCKLSD